MSIPTPPDLAEGRVTWTIGRGSSRALEAGRGVVRFRPSAVAANFSTVSALLEPVETPVLAGVMTPVDLIQNDPEVWNWVVEPLVGVQWEPFPIDVDGPVDLATAAQTPGKGPVRAVKGETGPGLTGEVRYTDGEVEFGIEDGSWTDPVTMPPGPPGPSNRLRIGTVTTSAAGDPAEASISGESPDQYLNLTVPRGEKPAIAWQGSTIVVDGVLGPDLRGATGQDSTVPGPANELSIGTVSTGAPGSQAAVTITGTAPNQTLGFAIPRGDQGVRGPAGNVKIERPEPGVWDFQPEELDVQVSDVQGLAAALAELKTTEWQKCDGVTSLVSGSIWWRFYKGRPELHFRDAMWGKGTTVTWGELAPAPPIDSTWQRYSADIPQGNNLPAASRVVMWNGGLYFPTESPGPMRGTFPYSL